MMLRCSCVQGCLRAAFADALEAPHRALATPFTLSVRARPLRHATPRLRQRSYATQSYLQARDRPQTYSAPLTPFPPPRNKPARRKEEGGDRKEPEPSIFKKSELEKELRWLRDPLKLADRVVVLLRDEQYFKALALVRLASRELMCTVAWNHLVDWDMARGRVQAGVKTYNEVCIIRSGRESPALGSRTRGRGANKLADCCLLYYR